MTAEYILHGTTLALASFAVANAFVSAGVAICARRLDADGRSRGERWWLMLRGLPALASVMFVLAVFVPSFVRFEPRETSEGFDLTLTLCAAAGAGLLLAAAVRGLRACVRSARQASVWMNAGARLPVRASIPAYSIGPAPMPLMTLAGLRSPRVFVSDRLLGVLTAEELNVALAHEASHARARDNFKRLLFRVLPDALAGTAAAAAIERRWALEAERMADRAATADDPAAQCALASALVKAARLMTAPTPLLEPVSTLVGTGDLAQRVESLLGGAPAGRATRQMRWAVVPALVAVAIAYAPLLRVVHQVTEVLVNSLP